MTRQTLDRFRRDFEMLCNRLMFGARGKHGKKAISANQIQLLLEFPDLPEHQSYFAIPLGKYQVKDLSLSVSGNDSLRRWEIVLPPSNASPSVRLRNFDRKLQDFLDSKAMPPTSTCC